MTLTKKSISKNLSKKLDINSNQGAIFFDTFIDLIIKNSKNKRVKILNFGVFFNKISPKRIGRNPKTMESYIIQSRTKLFFLPSNNIKKEIN